MATEHLGGEWPGGDPASLYPELWDYLIDVLEVRSMLDVGCGAGAALDYFASRGCHVRGVDGVEHGRPDVLVHDYTTGPLDPFWLPDDRFDVVWSCEFVEHVDEEFVPNFLPTFRAGRLLLLTHALPGQLGHHHVNCRWSSYWIRRLELDGWTFDSERTFALRRLAEANWEERNYFARSGLVLWRP